MLAITSAENKANPYFGTRFATRYLIETASGRWLTRDGIRNTAKTVSKLMQDERVNLDSSNFQLCFEKVSEALNKNYPQLKSASDEIADFCDNNKNLSNTAFFQAVSPIIKKHENIIGKFMNITIKPKA